MNGATVEGRKLTWIPDRVKQAGERADFRAENLLGKGAVPARSSNGDLVLSILNQGGLGSCTAFGTRQAIRALQVLMRLTGLAPALGPEPELASALWLYYLARAYDHNTANDDGAQIRNVFAGATKYGICPESTWAYDDNASPGAKFSRMPSPDAWKAAIDAKFEFSAHRITSTGYARIDDIKRALGQRRLVVFGTQVNEAFCRGELDVGRPVDPPSDDARAGQTGGHCMAIQDHEGDAFKVVNSWSELWGDRGRWTSSADYLAWEESRDFWVCDAAPANLIAQETT